MRKIVKICENPDLTEAAAAWFHDKWGIPIEVYRESMRECSDARAVPQWYVMLDGGGIIAGLGVIENDFHERRDLTPNICAVYVEENFRCRGIAGELLGFACEDMRSRGVDTLYLLTDHKGFYERYGWEYLCPVRGDGEERMSGMYVHR